MSTSYWEERKNYNYYKRVIEILNEYDAEFGKLPSILDVGCADTPIATYGNFESRNSLDISDREEINGVNKMIGDFMEIEFDKQFSVVTCLQTIEHAQNPTNFIKKLFSVASHFLIISLPIKWSPIKCHISNNITEETVLKWAAREATSTKIVADGSHVRGVFSYDVRKIHEDN